MTQIQKQQFKNETGGWVGAVVIGPRGDDRGVGVEPGGTVWLSEAEQRLTANAPRRPEDNPFIEQSREDQDPVSGETVVVKFTPLVPVSENRYVPAGERPIPGDASGATQGLAAQAAATGPEPQTAVADSGTPESRTAEVEAMGEGAKPNFPPPPARAQAAVDNAPPEPAPTPATPEPPSEPQEPPVQPTEPPQQADEEHAVQTDPQVGEETGAATPPAGAPPEGEYAASEEVGTPVPPQQPAPWSPGSTEG